ncbi:6,7-dimethyl-8-ribityllumazine synthase [Pediococcus siamensis]|uniref:6,7-dimethyl-8-ribityllumazine synthase n=1 Tax=Pediococcus siamensis TaxID=381829 RepID=UPI0039A1338A
MKEYKGTMNGKNKRVGIVVADFNDLVTQKLLTGAIDELQKLGIESKNLTVVHVPGAFELPRGAKQLSLTKAYDGLIALGSVIKGETSHYDYICSQTANRLAQVSLEGQVAVMFGVLTTDNLEQAINRAGGKGGNKGRECAQGLVQMMGLDDWLTTAS